jgi:Uncharacterized protein conserved in bacteria
MIYQGRIICFLIALSSFIGQIRAANPQINNSYRIIHNNDGTDALGNYWFHRRPLSVADLNAYVDMVSNSQVTTFMMCSGSDFPYYRSKYNRLFCDDKNGALTCGNDTAAYRNFKKFYTNFLNLEKEGTDLVAATLNRAKKNGLEAFITYRMNDLHFNDTTTHCPLLYTDFWYNHPQYWINDGTPGFNASRALDFAHPEVRAHKLAMITEQLQKYDMIDGFDLDFMRFIVYFKQGQGRKNAPLITQLVKDIRAKVDSVSARRGKKILLSVRVPPTIEICIDKGLDIQEWIRLKLIDFISIGVHWRGDPSLPVAKFRKELGAPNIPIYASIDDGGYRQRETYSHGMLRGMASHILAQGADGLYLFNQYYGEYNSTYNGNIHLEEGGQICRVNMPLLLKEMGSLKTLEYRNKIYCLNDSSGEYGMVPVSPLPLQVSAKAAAKADIFVGDNPAKTVPKEAILFLRTNHPANFDLLVNGTSISNQKPEYVQLYDRARGLQKGEQEYAFVVPAKCLKQGYNTIIFKEKSSKDFRVKRLEIALKYGEVETNGYF